MVYRLRDHLPYSGELEGVVDHVHQFGILRRAVGVAAGN
jgi:hypothetical protein